MPRIALIHATRVAMVPVELAFRAGWPEAEAISLLDEALSVDMEQGRVSTDALNKRIVALARHAMSMDPDGILFTCSSFGPGIEQAARELPLPVLKPNEAMFDAAIDSGGQATMLYTFAPAVSSMEQEFREAVTRKRADARIVSIYIPDALRALKNGDAETHDGLIAEAAAKVQDAGAIMLAHFSMSRAAGLVRGVTEVPVLTSPETAVTKIKRLLSCHAEKQ